MGIDVSPEVMVGIEFLHECDAEEYIESVFGVAVEEYGSIMEIEVCKRLPNLFWQEIDAYRDVGGILGKHVSESDLRYKSKEVDSIWEELYSIFPQEDHDKIDVHIWARYW